MALSNKLCGTALTVVRVSRFEYAELEERAVRLSTYLGPYVLESLRAKTSSCLP